MVDWPEHTDLLHHTPLTADEKAGLDRLLAMARLPNGKSKFLISCTTPSGIDPARDSAPVVIDSGRGGKDQTLTIVAVKSRKRSESYGITYCFDDDPLRQPFPLV